MPKHEQTSIKTKNCKHCTNFRQKGLPNGSKHGIIYVPQKTKHRSYTERKLQL